MSQHSESGSVLVVEFVGTEYEVVPGTEFTFGRSADLIIDENPYLHRVVGRFIWSNGLWWLVNAGTSIALRLADIASPSYMKVAPGTQIPMSFESARLSFEAGASNYELSIELINESDDGDFSMGDRDDVDDAEATTTAASLPLNAEQRLLLVALSAPSLREPGNEFDLPTNREVASALGWTITKFNRKLDGLCRKYSSAGVSGLRGSSDLLARDRRLRLVEHVVTSGVITDKDLALLPD